MDDPSRPSNENPDSDLNRPSIVATFWRELKQRKVVRVASVYLIAAWLVIQVASDIFPSLMIPEWVLRFVIVGLILGFPIVLVLAWAFDITPEGIKAAQAPRHENKRTGLAAIVGAVALTLIVGAVAVFFYIESPSDTNRIGPVAAGEPAEVVDTENSVAVMPLINMSSNEENAYFAGGVHEDILTNLSHIQDLKVISRTTMLRYAASELTLPDIGRELKVDYIVEGSVRRIGNHVRVTVQLIDARNDHHMWASNYERELDGGFGTQSALAKEISDSLHLEIQPDTVGILADNMPTTSVLAYDLYVKSISLEKTEGETEGNMIRRRAMLEKAVQADPNFVEAWAVLKRIYDLMLSRMKTRGWYLSDGADRNESERELLELSNLALAKAVALDPENVETLLSLAVDHVWPKPSEAMAEQRKILDYIIEQYPDNAKAYYHLGWWYRHLPTLDDANSFAAFEEALSRDPFNARMVSAVLTRYRLMDDQENVTRLFERLEQIIPETSGQRHRARIDPVGMANRLSELFVTTADESMIDGIAGIAQTAGPAADEFLSDAVEYRVLLLRNEPDLLLALAEKYSVASASDGPQVLRALINRNFTALAIYQSRGQSAEVKRIARRLIEAVNEPWARDYATSFRGGRAAVAVARGILGDIPMALEAVDEFLENGVGSDASWAALILQWFDLDRAVEILLSEKEAIPLSPSLDWAAALQIENRPLVNHPKIQAYYVKQGKWIDYLAARVPEYEKYKQAGQ